MRLSPFENGTSTYQVTGCFGYFSRGNIQYQRSWKKPCSWYTSQLQWLYRIKQWTTSSHPMGRNVTSSQSSSRTVLKHFHILTLPALFGNYRHNKERNQIQRFFQVHEDHGLLTKRVNILLSIAPRTYLCVVILEQDVHYICHSCTL